MHRRKSFLFRLFALLFALLLLITASVELALYHYARQVVGQGVHPPQPGGPAADQLHPWPGHDRYPDPGQAHR